MRESKICALRAQNCRGGTRCQQMDNGLFMPDFEFRYAPFPLCVSEQREPTEMSYLKLMLALWIMTYLIVRLAVQYRCVIQVL